MKIFSVKCSLPIYWSAKVFSLDSFLLYGTCCYIDSSAWALTWEWTLAWDTTYMVLPDCVCTGLMSGEPRYLRGEISLLSPPHTHTGWKYMYMYAWTRNFFYCCIIYAGGILRIAGIAMTPRIILMTDGQPTDTRAGEEEVLWIILKMYSSIST